MHIQWLGGTSFKIQTKPQTDDIVVILDPYKQETGTFPRSLTPHIAIATKGTKNILTLSGDPFIISNPGEFETKSVLIQATAGTTEKTMIARLDAEKLSIAHIGETKEQPTNQQLETITGIDILTLPVGGENGYTPEQAVKVINIVEPRIVIPHNFKSDNNPNAEPIEKFIKEFGITPQKPGNKVIIKKKDLPQEDMWLIILDKET
jgi:hypothetical protein